MDSKIKFLKAELPAFLMKLDPAANGKWGVMNAQQMVEHVSDYVRIANGKDKRKVMLTPEQVQKAHAFMMTDKPFRENTPNQLMSSIPPAWRNKSMSDAVEEMKSEINYFFTVYAAQPDLRLTNPFFGELNYKEQLHLLHKHTMHHARQFGWE